MRWRPFHLGLLLVQAFWLNVMVPGHTRGMMLLPGARAQCGGSGPVSSSCCSTRPAPDGKPHQPTPSERAHCAICFFAARLMLPPVSDWRLEPLGFWEMLALPAPDSKTPAGFTSAHYCRGPPIQPV